MIFKEVGQTMDLLLVKVAEEHHIPLKQAFEEIKDSLHDDYMSGLIQEYLDHGYQYSELIQEKPDVGFKGLRMYEMRYYVFCTSLDNL